MTQSSTTGRQKPNILFLFSDQHNARCLSCAEHPDVKTPHLDRLAADGVRFTSAYAQNPICTPSRMCYLSGLYPSTHGYYGLYGPEPQPRLTSLFRYFKEQGYRTGALGKLHTPRYWIERDCQFVYDEFIEYPKYLEGAGLYGANDNRAFNGNRDGEPSLVPLEHSCEVALAGQTTRFLRNQGEPADQGDEDAPWLAWVSFARPHQPYTPSEPYASMYPPEAITLPPTASTETPEIRARRQEINEAHLRQIVSAYLGLVSQVDYGIGLILEELAQQNLLENTIIVYASDHGDYAGEHGLFEKRGGLSTRAITRVPLIVRYPQAVSRSQTCEEIVESVDVFPTLCDLAGVEVPNHVQGRSFFSMLAGDPGPIRDNALTENPYRKALATKGWRYVANIEGQADELYDQENDPWELQNRIDDPEYASIARQMERTLLDRLARAQRPVTTINGFWHDHKYDRDGRVDLARCGDINPYW